jgi:diaminopimelate epimerase
MSGLELSKYHGAGNDFLLLDRRRGAPSGALAGRGLDGRLDSDPGALAELAVRLCHRRYGVGADGILLVGSSDTAGCDASMVIVNSDGSPAEMCGNGLRCVVKHLLDAEPARQEITVDTGAGLLACRAERDGTGRVGRVRVDMGRPILERARIPLSGEGSGVREPIDQPGGQALRFTAVSMGNPHAVIFVEGGGNAENEGAKETRPVDPTQGDPARADPAALARRLGPGLETHPRFPNKANISFVRPEPGGRLVAAVWERGAGLTAACGTGACAIGVAAVLEGRAEPATPIPVALPGGQLEIQVAPGSERVLMTGPAVRVFTARVDLDALAEATACRRLDAVMGR